MFITIYVFPVFFFLLKLLISYLGLREMRVTEYVTGSLNPGEIRALGWLGSKLHEKVEKQKNNEHLVLQSLLIE